MADDAERVALMADMTDRGDLGASARSENFYSGWGLGWTDWPDGWAGPMDGCLDVYGSPSKDCANPVLEHRLEGHNQRLAIIQWMGGYLIVHIRKGGVTGFLSAHNTFEDAVEAGNGWVRSVNHQVRIGTGYEQGTR